MQSHGILWKSFNPPEVNSVFLGFKIPNLQVIPWMSTYRAK